MSDVIDEDASQNSTCYKIPPYNYCHLLQVLYVESDAVDKRRRQLMSVGGVGGGYSPQESIALSSPQQLSRVWSWMYRIQEPSCLYPHATAKTPVLSVSCCGAIQIMSQNSGSSNDIPKDTTSDSIQEDLGCIMYNSRRRATLR